ncbi:DUF3309 family protein [Cupriavidus basilensis]
MLGTILLILLILVLIGAMPAWPHSRNWATRPAACWDLVLLIVIVLLVEGRLI